MVALEYSRCPLGCAFEDELILAGRDRLYNRPGEFNVVKCGGCGLVRTDPRPTPEAIGFYYPDNYGPWVNSYGNQHAIQRRRPRLSKRLKQWLIGETYATILPSIPPGRMLEIGCAAGTFMQH